MGSIKEQFGEFKSIERQEQIKNFVFYAALGALLMPFTINDAMQFFGKEAGVLWWQGGLLGLAIGFAANWKVLPVLAAISFLLFQCELIDFLPITGAK